MAKWEPKLQAAVTEPCRANPFTADCVYAMRDLELLAEELEQDASAQGYPSLASSARKVSSQAHRWYSVCALSKPNTQERVGCVTDTYQVVLTGGRQLLASLYEAVQSSK